jgi:hypothetical protein
MSYPFARYIRDVGPASAAYVLSVVGAALLVKEVDTYWLRVLVAAIPLPAIAWLAWAEFSRLRRRDELRQRVELEAMTIAFSVSLFGILMLGYFEMFGVFQVGMQTAAIFMLMCWFGAQLFVRMRYRYWWSDADSSDHS